MPAYYLGHDGLWAAPMEFSLLVVAFGHAGLSENSGPFGNSRTKDAINPSLGAWLRPSGPQTPLSGSTRTSLEGKGYNFHRWLWPLAMLVYLKIWGQLIPLNATLCKTGNRTCSSLP